MCVSDSENSPSPTTGTTHFGVCVCVCVCSCLHNCSPKCFNQFKFISRIVFFLFFVLFCLNGPSRFYLLFFQFCADFYFCGAIFVGKQKQRVHVKVSDRRTPPTACFCVGGGGCLGSICKEGKRAIIVFCFLFLLCVGFLLVFFSCVLLGGYFWLIFLAWICFKYNLVLSFVQKQLFVLKFY